ncbi:MAG: tail fiber domain-containing protein [Dysgonamonadaceae bacterium]|jgi:F0F1-type ATP synthase membrane subunit b/b'|nr:tail fiber domain-containing protein [Dysgonamonadaceae bacterium]
MKRLFTIVLASLFMVCAVTVSKGSSLTKSDSVLKKDIRDIDNAFALVQGLRGVSFYYSGDSNKREYLGFVAEEVREVIPQLVFDDGLGNLGLNYQGFVPVLTNAIREQQAIIETQQVSIVDRQKQIDELKSLLRSVVAKSPVVEPVLYQDEEGVPYIQDVQEIENSLAIVKELQGVSFYHADDLQKKETFGFITDEVGKILPNLVHYDNLGYPGMSYDEITPVLVNAIREQQAIIEKQQATAENLQEQIDELKDLLEPVAGQIPAVERVSIEEEAEEEESGAVNYPYIKNVRELGNTLDIVLKLRGVKFSYTGDSENRKHFGFIAKEVSEVLPSIVDGTGIAYSGFIPVLANAIKERQSIIENQQATADNQQAEIDALKGLIKSTIFKVQTDVPEVEVPSAVLYQNTPNPWKETTEIRYILPEGAREAAVYISDLSGKLLKTLPATNSGVIVLEGSDLKAGIYTCSLVVNGVIIDTKKMLLTK